MTNPPTITAVEARDGLSAANARLVEIIDGWAIAEECDLPLDRVEKLMNAARAEGPQPPETSGEDGPVAWRGRFRSKWAVNGWSYSDGPEKPPWEPWNGTRGHDLDALYTRPTKQAAVSDGAVENPAPNATKNIHIHLDDWEATYPAVHLHEMIEDLHPNQVVEIFRLKRVPSVWAAIKFAGEVTLHATSEEAKTALAPTTQEGGEG